MKITYSSNNSGGEWWLTTSDWRALEEAGWSVEWRDSDVWGKKRGDREFATTASVDRRSMGMAIAEFEDITEQNADDPGCPCCGQPHNFFYNWD